MCLGCVGFSAVVGGGREIVVNKILSNKQVLLIRQCIVNSSFGNWVKQSPKIKTLNSNYSIIKQRLSSHLLGLWIKKVLKISSPATKKEWWMTKIITSSLLVLTTLALKKLFNFSFCQGKGLNLKAIILLTLVNIPLEKGYAIAVSICLKKFIYPLHEVSCCCSTSTAPIKEF